jgi:hypothetical protein
MDLSKTLNLLNHFNFKLTIKCNHILLIIDSVYNIKLCLYEKLKIQFPVNISTHFIFDSLNS